MKTIKQNRKGLTRTRWTEILTAVLKMVGLDPKIEFEDGSINVNDFSIVPHDWEEVQESVGQKIKIVHRGYMLVEWVHVPATYHEPDDVYDRELGTFDDPYKIVAEIGNRYFAERLNGTLEGYEQEDAWKEEQKFWKEMEERQEEEAKDFEIDHVSDERATDALERHNRQVLSRL